MKTTFVRAEDYWVFPISFFGVLFAMTALYAGVFWIRFLTGLAGLGILGLTAFIIRKNYSSSLAARYMIICLLLAALAALGAYALTN